MNMVLSLPARLEFPTQISVIASLSAHLSSLQCRAPGPLALGALWPASPSEPVSHLSGSFQWEFSWSGPFVCSPQATKHSDDKQATE